ncbi:unnamed protein product [Tenebrio molitor]|nr:unnamed protein product [Tenebrio molitor]
MCNVNSCRSPVMFFLTQKKISDEVSRWEKGIPDLCWDIMAWTALLEH